MTTESLKPEYFPTVFIGEKPKDGWPEAFAFVTACNPDGQTVSDELNLEANQQLETELGNRELSYSLMTGSSPDQSHQEPGFLILCSQETAIELGRKYQQDAVFWIEHGELYIASCKEDTVVSLGKWEDPLLP